MRKLISYALVVVILASMPLTAEATTCNDLLSIDESLYDMDAFYHELWAAYESNISYLWNYVCGDQCNSYVQIANEFEDDPWLGIVTGLTGQELTKERYIEILVNLMALMSYSTHEMMEEQIQADTLKTFGDYAVDATEILVGTVSLTTAFGSRITAPMKKITTAIGLTWDTADLIIDTRETYQYLDWELQTYENYDLFLSIIIQNTDDENLKQAATELSDITNKAFYCKMNAVTEMAEDSAEYLGNDVFFDTIVIDLMLENASILELTESDFATLDLLGKTYSVFTTALSYIQDWSVFISDMIGGSSDVMNRYNEMLALTRIRNALIEQIEVYRSDIKDVSDFEKIEKVRQLMMNLICINYRGEYCAHEMLVHDGQAFSLAIKVNGKTSTYDEAFEEIKRCTHVYIEMLNSIYPEKELYRLEQTENARENKNVSAIDITEYYWYLNIQFWEVKSFEKDGTVKTYYTEAPLEPSEDLVLSESDLTLDTFYNATYTFDGTNLIISYTDYDMQLNLELYNKATNPAVIKDQFTEKQINEYSGSDYFYQTAWEENPIYVSDNAAYLVRLGKKQTDHE